MNQDDLKELREIFRARMRDEDFCIGEDKVETLFRELLNEVELEDEPINTHVPVDATKMLAEAQDFASQMMKNTFERDDVFYSKLKK